MAQANYVEVARAIRNMQTFSGNSCFGTWANGSYLVVSYQTTIAKYDSVTGDTYLDECKYSKTTSRLQNIVKKEWVL